MEKKQTGRKKQQIKRKKERMMFESGMKMLIGGISDKGGNQNRMLDMRMNTEKKQLERNGIREERC